MKNIFIKLLYKEKMKFINIFILNAFEVFLMLFRSLLIIYLFNTIRDKNIQEFLKLLLLFVLVNIMRIIISKFNRFYSFVSKEKIFESLYIILLEKSNLKSKDDISDKQTSWLLNDLEILKVRFFDEVNSLEKNILFILFSIITLFFINKTLLLVSMCIIISITILSKKFNYIYEKALTKFTIFNDGNIKEISNIVSNINVFKMFNRYEKSKTLVNEKLRDYFNENNNFKKIELKIMGGVGFLSIASQILIISFASFLVLMGQISIGVILAVGEICGELSNNIGVMLKSLADIYSSINLFKKYDEYIQNEIKKEYLSTKVETLNLNDVCLRFEDRKYFENFYHEFKKGKKYIVIGDSGSGKSTLVKMLIGLINPSSGNVYINGVDIEDISKEYIFDNISFIDSNNYILEANIYDNISLYNEDKLRVEEIIKLLELDNIDKEMYLNEENISQGQKQRINIARALYFDRDVVMIDEAFVNLDKNLREKLENIFLESGKTIIMITHQYNEEYLKKFDVVIRK